MREREREREREKGSDREYEDGGKLHWEPTRIIK